MVEKVYIFTQIYYALFPDKSQVFSGNLRIFYTLKEPLRPRTSPYMAFRLHQSILPEPHRWM